MPHAFNSQEKAMKQLGKSLFRIVVALLLVAGVVYLVGYVMYVDKPSVKRNF